MTKELDRVPSELEGLGKNLKALDLKNPVSKGHLISGRLGTIPINIRRGWITLEEAQALVERFNEITGLNVTYDTKNNELKY